VAAENGINRRSEPDNPAAQIKRAHFKRQDGVIETGL
jgi:hypothetical protein